MEKKKIFCGNGKSIGENGTVAVSVCLDDIPAEFITVSVKNGKRYVSLYINKNREVDQYGKTHNITVDTWKPDPNKAKPIPVIQVETQDGTDGDFPF